MLAPFSLLPFISAEAVRYFRSRRVDYGMWAALVLPLTLVLLYIPLYQSYKSIVFFPLAFQASMEKLASFYWHAFRDVFWCLSLAFAAAWLANRRRLRRRGLRASAPDTALFLTIAIVPMVVDLALMHDRSPFWGRYCITSSFAFYVLFTAGFSSTFSRSSRAAGAAVSAVCTLLIIQKLIIPAYAYATNPPARDAAVFSHVKPNLPIVAASGLTFVEMGQHESSSMMKRIYYLHDRDAAIKFAHATLFEDMADFQRAFNLPGTVEEYNAFTRAHTHFLVLGTPDYPEDWLLRKLAADRAIISLVAHYSVPYKDSSLYEVHLGDGSQRSASREIAVRNSKS